MPDTPEWLLNLQSVCKAHNIPIEHLSTIILDQKVMPMIRGKAFEFSAVDLVRPFLLPPKWTVEKLNQNPQFGVHDEDIKVTNTLTNNYLRVECKLAAKGRFKKLTDDTNTFYIVGVKCMRSRTLGTAMVKKLAPILGLAEDVLAIHNDQYRKEDFDIILTTLANAFYETDDDGNYYWCPGDDGTEFLKALTGETDETKLQDLAFSSLYFTKSEDRIITPANNIQCTRRKCENKTDCQFIPNYPVIIFDASTMKSVNNWNSINDIDSIFSTLT